MSLRRELEARLALYADLAGILKAMRSFALAELHRLQRREPAQREVLATLEDSMRELASNLPSTPAPDADVWLLFGSVRGFCGAFNDDVARAWREGDVPAARTVVIGEHLAVAMAPATGFVTVAGATGALDAPAAIGRMLGAVRQIAPPRDTALGLVACLRGETRVERTRLWPPTLDAAPSPGLPSLLQEPAAKVATEVAEQYLFHALLGSLLRSLAQENRSRLMQMDNALRHIDESTERLHGQRNRLRQEEIVEEIEAISGTRRGPHRAVGPGARDPGR